VTKIDGHRAVAGTTAAMVRDVVALDGEVAEETVDWCAQDDSGTVCYLGEDACEIEEGGMGTTELIEFFPAE
jgi:hypothetical protein